MTYPVTITGLTRVARPKPNMGGSTVLAYFNCDVAGFRLKGCALVRTPKNGLVAWPPKVDTAEGGPRSIAITDDAIRHGMMLHAREAYRALGGTDAEYIGQARRPSMGPRDAFVPCKAGDTGFDGFPLDRDLTEEEAAEGMTRYLEAHGLAQSQATNG